MGAFSRVRNILLPDEESDGLASEAFRKQHGKDATAAQEFRAKWGWEPHEQIIIKGAFNAGDQEAIANVSTALDAENKPLLLTGNGRTHMLERMIVSWTLSDETGKIVEVNLANILRLPTNYTTPILEVCDRLAVGMSAKAQKDFLNSANGHTLASLDVVK